MKIRNPFFIKGYHGAEYFCDREKETAKILAAVRNGRDVTLMAPRRYGKTGLIHHAFSKLGEGFVPLYIDIFQMSDLAEFTRAFSGAVVSRLATAMERTGRGVLNFFRSCRPTMTPQEDGSVSFSFDIVSAKAESTLKETFSFLESRKVEPVIAIDEFQQIRAFPETGVEAFLRSHVQFCHNAHFIFAGSQRHLMEEMFALPRGPFYQSTQLLSLDVIGRTEYRDFARNFFARVRRSFDVGAFDRLYDRFDGVTWYLQAVLNRVWDAAVGLSDASVDEAVANLVDEGEQTYDALLRSQTDAARRILCALAETGGTSEISSKEYVDRHGLPSPSTVRSSASDLIARDLVYKSERGYRVYDRLFEIWLKATNSSKGNHGH